MGTIDLSQVNRRRSLLPTPELPLLRAGFRLGRYRLLEPIGHGGEAEIWSAWDERQQQVVAMKLMPRQGDTPYDADRVSNEFEKQVQVVAGLSHPHVLPLYEFGQSETHFYFVMRYSCFGSLADLLLQGPLPLTTVLLITAQISSALTYLHEELVVHRDLKPGNILLDSQRRVYLADFGLAKRLAQETKPLHTGRGTGSYAPFEQHALQGMIPQSDIFSLGVVIYEMLTGQLPWAGITSLAEQQHRSQQEMPDPRDIRPELPEGIAAVLREMTAFRWKDRPETAAAAFQLFLTAFPEEVQAPFLDQPQRPPPINEQLYIAQDAAALAQQLQSEWDPNAAMFPARLTHFILMNGVYTRPDAYKVEADEAIAHLLLRGAIACDYNLDYWWQAVTDPQARVTICEQTFALETDKAGNTLLNHLLNQPEDTLPVGTFSQATLEHLLDRALHAQTWPTRDQAFRLLARLASPAKQWQRVGLSEEGDVRLAQLALQRSSQAIQAAQLIGRLRSETAVRALLDVMAPGDGTQVTPILDALQEIQATAGHLPLAVPLRLRWQILGRRLQQQWREDSPGFSLPRSVIGFGAGLLVCLFFLLGLFDSSATRLQDVLLQPHPTSGVVTIVTVNDASIARYGRWDRWPRTLHADLVARLKAAGAKAIVFDFVFDTPTEDDAVLAAAMRQAGNVVQPVLGVGDALLDQPDVIRYEAQVLPTPLLLDAAAAIGSTNVLHDSDGVVRRLPTLMTVEGQVHPSLVLTALAVFLGNQPGLPQAVNEHLPFIGRDIPVDERGVMQIYYAGPPTTPQSATFRWVSYQDVLDGAAAPELFRDKIVLVGITATAEPDRYLTPISQGRPMYGVEILANAIEAIWSGHFIRQPHLAVTLLTILSLSLWMGWFASRPWWGVGWLVGLAIFYFLGASLIFDRTGLALNLFYPLLGLLLSYGSATVYRLTVTSRRNRELMQLFAARVSPATATAAIMAVQKGEIDLSGRDAELSALVVQLRGQEMYATRHGPEAMLGLVNQWREFVVAAAFGLEGTVIDLKSDEFLVLFNTPLPQRDHTSRALRAALMLRERTHSYRQQYPPDHPEQKIGFGCGLHTGHAIVGFTGSAPRYVYTALGEAIEGATELAIAAADDQILLSHQLYEKVKGLLGGLPVEIMALTGIEKPVAAIARPNDE